MLLGTYFNKKASILVETEVKCNPWKKPAGLKAPHSSSSSLWLLLVRSKSSSQLSFPFRV